MISIVEFLINHNKHTQKLTLTLQEILDKYNPEYMIICYYQDSFEIKPIEKGYIICMGSEDKCNLFAGVDKWNEKYVQGVNSECDDKIADYVKTNFNQDVDLNDSGWFIEYHQVKNLLKMINDNNDEDALKQKFNLIK